jgi:hypothetical protein
MAAVRKGNRRRRRRVTRAVVGTLVLLGVAVTAVVLVLGRNGTPLVVQARCAATASGSDWYLSPAQADNAALISAIAVRRQLPARATTIALAVALQESKLANLDHGDRDSVGLFQQRPSQGWGTIAQLQDPVFATNAFYDALVKVDGYQDLPITEASQRVQRSGFPEAYAAHEPLARAWASALTGNSPTSLTCTLRPADGASSGKALTDRVARDLGNLPVTEVGGPGSSPATATTVVVSAGSLGTGTAAENSRVGWAVAEWAVAIADSQRATTVATADKVWTRASGTWSASATGALAPGEVRITLERA